VSATEIWTLKAAITHRGGIASHVSLACYLLMEELIGLDESIYVNVFRIATRTKTSLVYIGNERISMTLHEQSNKALEALGVWQPSPFKNVE
jgi:hypothetical protein